MIKFIQSSAKDLLGFLKNPRDVPHEKQEITFKIQSLIFTLVIVLGLAYLVFTPSLKLIEATGWVDFESHAVTQLLKTITPWKAILILGLAIPLLEELIFRTFLKFRRNFPLQFIILLSGLGGKQNKRKVKAYLFIKWRKYYKYFFYLMAIIFALIHISNFELTTIVFLLAPLLVFSQFIAGLALGYLRVRFGLIWGFYLHALYNSILIGIPLLFIDSIEVKLDKENTSYKIKVEELYSPPRKSVSSISNSNISFENFKLKNILETLLNKDGKLLTFTYPEKADIHLNVNFTQFNDSINSNNLILEHLQEIYNFSIKREEEYFEWQDLTISDSSLLSLHTYVHKDTIGPLTASVTSSEKDIRLEAYTLNSLVKVLNEHFHPYIRSEIPAKTRFNFTLPVQHFDSVKKCLLEKYGLTMVEKKNEFELITIEFSE